MEMRRPSTEWDAYEQALMAAAAAGLKPQAVACEMWPDMTFDSAYQRLRACVTATKREKFSLEELTRFCSICAQGGALGYAPLYWLADRCDHRRPERYSKEARLQEMAEKITATASQFNELVTQFNHIAAGLQGNPEARFCLVSTIEVEAVEAAPPVRPRRKWKFWR